MEDEHCNLAFVVFLEFYMSSNTTIYCYYTVNQFKKKKWGSRPVHVFYILDICVFF